MKLTEEQKDIVEYVQCGIGDLIVNAYAGTGKTTTTKVAIEVIAGKTKYKPVYLVYNKKNREEAQRKLKRLASVHTFHSLAYSYLKKEEKQGVRRLSFVELRDIIEAVTKIDRKKTLNYLTYAIKNYLSGNIGEAKKFWKFAKVEDIELQDLALRVVREQVRRGTIDFDAMILKLIREIEEGKRRINKKTVFVDEAQDINPIQEKLVSLIAERVIAVGDTHQSIYKWRGANGYFLKRKEVERKYLTISWRIPPRSLQEEIANKLLGLKGEKKKLKGMNLYEDRKKTKAIISRKNITLIELALGLLQRGERFRFVRPLEELLGLPADIYRLFYLGQRPVIHNWLLLFKDIKELERFATENEDIELQNALYFCSKYNPITVLKALTEAESWGGVELTTAHSSKGLEWSEVELLDDFPDLPAEAEKLAKEEGISQTQAWERILREREEEINLLYVAVTRAREKLILPPSLWILGFDGNFGEEEK